MVLRVGFYIELNPDNPGIFKGSIRDAVGDLPGDNEEDLIAYLENGIRLVDIMEAEPDVIAGDQYISGSSSVLTDGEWIWRADLTYYLRRYHLHLDEEFLNHARGRSYKVQSVPKERVVAIAREVAGQVLGMS
jgi:hypothetical protein